MARNGVKSGGRDFVKGKSGNPKGMSKTGVTQARRMTAEKFSEIVLKYMDFTLAEVDTKFRDPTTPALDLIVLKILHESIKKGDNIRMNFLLERTIGKVKDIIDHQSSDKSMSPAVTFYIPSNRRDDDQE